MTAVHNSTRFMEINWELFM